MENCPFMDDFPTKNLHLGFSMAMLVITRGYLIWLGVAMTVLPWPWLRYRFLRVARTMLCPMHQARCKNRPGMIPMEVSLTNCWIHRDGICLSKNWLQSKDIYKDLSDDHLILSKKNDQSKDDHVIHCFYPFFHCFFSIHSQQRSYGRKKIIPGCAMYACLVRRSIFSPGGRRTMGWNRNIRNISYEWYEIHWNTLWLWLT